MSKSNNNEISIIKLNKKGLSLMELIVISVVIAITACMAFPSYKIIQQRSKEERLKKILTDVRAAINGTKSHRSTQDFEEGFRTVTRVKGMEMIMNPKPDDPNYALFSGCSSDEKQRLINAFVAELVKGYGYPTNPEQIWSKSPTATITISLGVTHPDIQMVIPLGRRFYRKKPVHPFHDWFSTADFCFVNASGTVCCSYTEWMDKSRDRDYHGVKDIVSRGAGLALDGSNTDDW